MRKAQTIRQAIDGGHQLLITYASQSGDTSTRVVDPKEIAAIGKRQRAGLWAEEDGEVKSFLMKGIMEVEVIE